MDEIAKKRWFALDQNGDMVCVGEFDSFEDADESLKTSVVWLVDEETARTWISQLTEQLPPKTSCNEAPSKVTVANGWSAEALRDEPDGNNRLFVSIAALPGVEVRINVTPDSGLVVDVTSDDGAIFASCWASENDMK